MCSVSVLMTLMVEETYAMELIRVIQHTPVAERMFFQYTPFRTVRNIHVYQMLKERLYKRFVFAIFKDMALSNISVALRHRTF